ncbi:BglG family transcription antiterminator [Listeria welshimeri]|uniref:BglG family transcription antiterminator n=1 Tax=Listeria welshimeri TaxID=1643 RepID=UPI0010B13980|nr:BglG family transcription antiterminator [Listeria welshimeri]MBC1319452.1 BglG family transcription antiterminator [Listeria welshimeri]MBC1341161.1 BglG family transcription antiterminator [Listeria welshimeri]MBC1343374.1 BglG family transcription antiterminator [Listeria welshimeri]MBC1346590.1 BglG family transcription antiterminator [Listeria welshimeri]MBC1349472.1 BglG family transcription antiterminator [Listeria welshimeri]
MEQNCKELITYLLLNRQVNLRNVSKNFKVSKEAIGAQITQINHLLKSEPILIDHDMIFVTDVCREACYRLLTAEEQQLFSFYEVNIRRKLIMIKLLLHNHYMSLGALADYVYVSKNTMLTDVKSIKENLHEFEIQLDYSRKDGYAVSGSEFLIRNLLAELIREVVQTPYGKFVLDEKKLITVSEVFLLKKRLEKVESKLQITFTDEQMEELPYILHGIIKRSKVTTKKWTFKIELYDIKNTREFPIMKEMFWGYDFLSENDLLYLSLQVLASNLVESALHFSDSEEIAYAVDEFIALLEMYFATEIMKKNEFKEKVILHVRPAIYRTILGFQINNPLKKQFIKEYTSTFNIVEKASKPFEKLVGHKWSEEEIVYLSMIVLGWMYQIEETEQPIFRAVVLCKSGTSISKLLLENLKMMFPNIDFQGAYAVRQLKTVARDIDFIFTTVPVQSSATIFVIPSILSKDSRQTLREQVDKAIEMDSHKKTKELLAMLKDEIPEENIRLVQAKVESFFNKKEQPVEKKEPEQMRITAEQIHFLETPLKWEKLVSEAFLPLLKRGTVDSGYINTCEEIFYQNYEQMMIGPNIYLPHAKPVNGVIEQDIQLMIIKTDTRTPANEAVKMMIALAPSEQNKHIPLLLKLNEIFLQPEILAELLASTNKKKIVEILERG